MTSSLHGLALRPFTLGTLALCRQLGLSMFTDGAVPDTSESRERQVAAYLFLQSEPLDQVLTAVDDPEFEKKYLRLFKFRLTPKIMGDAMEMISANLNAAGEAVVDIEPKPGVKPEDAPPNS